MQTIILKQNDALEPVHSKKENDVLLWKRFQSGEEEAFAALYKKYVQVIYNYGRNYSCDEVLLEDCIHDLFLYLWKNKANLSVPSSVEYYLYASLRRRIHKESKKREQLALRSFKDAEGLSNEMNSLMEDLTVCTQSEALQEASLNLGLIRLSPNQRKAILLKFYKNLSFQEIALMMDIKIDTVYKLVQRGLVVLKKNVKP